MFQCVNHNVYRSSRFSFFFYACMYVSVAYENFIESNGKLLNQDYIAQMARSLCRGGGEEGHRPPGLCNMHSYFKFIVWIPLPQRYC